MKFMNRVTTLAGEQGIPDDNESTGMVSAKRAALAAGVVAGVGLVIYSQYFNGDTEAVEVAEAPIVTGSALPDVEFPKATTVVSDTQATEPPPVLATALPKTELPPALSTAPAKTVEPVVVVKYRTPPPPAIPDIHPGRSVAISVGQVAQAPAQQANGAPANAQDGTQDVASESGNDVAGVSSAQAVKLENLDTTILAGELMPCALNADLNSQIGGAFTCTVIQDIKSADGTQVLIGAGSQASGLYASDTSSAAVIRTAAVLGRLVTTDDNAINLDSAASDARGAVGIPADRVNRHVLTRFGSAFAVALISNAINTVGSSGDTTGDVIVNSATGSGTSDLATEVFRETAGIPSTRETDRGSIITIYVRKDLHFGGVL